MLVTQIQKVEHIVDQLVEKPPNEHKERLYRMPQPHFHPHKTCFKVAVVMCVLLTNSAFFALLQCKCQNDKDKLFTLPL